MEQQHDSKRRDPVEYKPTSMFSLLGDKNTNQVDKQGAAVDMEHLLQDDDIQKLERLQLINASARYELLTAN